MRLVKYASLSLWMISIVFFSACGGSTPGSSPTPSAATPTGTPPAGGTGSTTPASVDFYQASIFSVATGLDEPQTTSTEHRGTIRVNENASDGRGSLRITGGEPNAGYQLRFCHRGAPRALMNCVRISDYITDGAGAATLNFQMVPGGYSGAFYVFKNSAVRFAGGFNSSLSEPSYSTGLQPGASTPGRGRGEIVGRTARITITGGPPNETFRCQILSMTGGGADLGLLKTDAAGNGVNDPSVFGMTSTHPRASTGLFYCSAKCQTGTCEFTYLTSLKAQ